MAPGRHHPGCQGWPQGDRSPSPGDAARKGPGNSKRWGNTGTCTWHSSGVPGARLRVGGDPWPPASPLAPPGWKELSVRAAGSQVTTRSPLLPETILPQRGRCRLSPAAATGFVRAGVGRGTAAPPPGRAHLVPTRHGQSPPGSTEGVTPPGRGDTGGTTARCPPSPTSACQALPMPCFPAAGTGAGAQDGAGQRQGRAARCGRGSGSRAELCQASIPALSRPLPQGSLDMNRPFNLLRRLEGLAAGLLAGTRSPAAGIAQSCSRQALPPALPARGIPKPTPLPAPAVQAPRAKGPSTCPWDLACPTGLQHQPRSDSLMAFYSALNWVGKRHVPYPKSSLIALHGARHRALAGGSPGIQTLQAN